MKDEPTIKSSVRTTIEVSIRLLFLLLIAAGCFFLLRPFFTPVIGGIVLAVATSPFYLRLNRRLNNKPKISASIVIVICLALVLVPAGFFISSTVKKIKMLGIELQEGQVTIPAPNEKVIEWPFIGKDVFDFWKSASTNLEALLNTYNVEITAAGKWLVNAVIGVSWSVLQILLSIILAGIFLATPGTKEVINRFFTKLAGDRGVEMVKVSEITIQSVAKGILGVSILQSFLFCLIFIFSHVPYAGIWTLAILMIGIAQIPMGVATVPIIIYMFSTKEVGPAIAWSVVVAIVGLVDNVLKPILMAQGATVPMIVIFLGAIGGFIVSGFLGLFAGAIFLSLGYNLLKSWLEDENPSSQF